MDLSYKNSPYNTILTLYFSIVAAVEETGKKPNCNHTCKNVCKIKVPPAAETSAEIKYHGMSG